MFEKYTEDTWFRGKNAAEQASIIVLNATMACRRGDVTVTGYHAAIEWAQSLDATAADVTIREISDRDSHLRL